MNWRIEFRRPWVWLVRFRHRCGYGVHSPFAFQFITQVIYEKTCYYAYFILEQQESKCLGFLKKYTQKDPARVKKLLFRITNYAQPHTCVLVNVPELTAAYLKSAKRKAVYLEFKSSDKQEELPPVVDLLYIDSSVSETSVRALEATYLSRMSERGVLLIGGIGYSSAKKILWNELKANPFVGITFDLYDLGIAFFDRKKIKQHYIVNFS